MAEKTSTVIVVDGDTAQRRLTVDRLRRDFPQLKTRGVRGLADFRQALKTDHVCAVITERDVGWATDLDILQAVRESQPRCPVIMLTRSRSRRVAVDAMKAGMTDVLPKSSSGRSRLAGAIRSALYQPPADVTPPTGRADLRRMLDGVPVGLGRVAASGRFTDVNVALVALLSFPDRESLLATNIFSLFVEAEERRIWRRALKTREGVQIGEVRLRGRDGSEPWVEIEARPVSTPGVAAVEHDVGIRDISRRKAAEGLLSEKERRFRLLYERAPLAYQALDAHARLIEVNGAWLQLFGYRRDEVIGHRFTEFLAPDIRRRYKEKFPDFKATGRRHGAQVDIVRKDGSRAIVSLEGNTVRDERGRFLQTHCILRDVTEANRIEQDLHRAETRARTLLDIAGVMIVAIGSDQRVSLINKRGCDVLGYAEDEIVGKNWFDHFLPEEIREDVRSVFVGLIRGEAAHPAASYENPIVTSSGDRRLIAWHNSYLRDGDGRVTATLSSGEDVTEVRRATDQLAYLATFPELNPYPVVEIDGAGNLTYANAAAEELFPDLDPRGLVHPLLAGVEALNGALASGSTQKIPSVVRVGDRYYHRRIWHVPGQNRVRLYAADITERVRAEEALRESEGKFRDLAERSLVGVYLVQDWVYRYVNPRFAELYGYTVDEIIGKLGPKDLVVPGDWPRVETSLKRRLSGKSESDHYEARGVRRDGEIRPHEVYGTRTTYEGRPAVVGTLLDITDRRLAERALAESVERYRRLVEASPDAIGVQAGGRIVFVNPAMVRLLGVAVPGDLLGRQVMDFVHPDSRPLAVELIEATMAQSRVQPLVELRFLRKGGDAVDVEIAAIPFTYEGKPGTQIVARDISERKEVEQLKSDFLAMVSHELRTPLAVVLGYATVIERALAPDDAYQRVAEAARTIHDRSAHMASLVDNLLDMSQIQSGTFDLDLDVIDIEHLVRAAVESTPRPAGHTIKVRVSGAIPPVTCDPNRISIAIANLLSNAVKFSPESRTISVDIEHEGTVVRISVRDRGVGVAAKDRARIFDRFTQGDMSSTRAFGGVGMGLYVARRIVEAHGGSIKLRSAKGKGSTFTIEVPVKRTI